MMDQIIITFVLISLFCKASGQLQCLVCTNCPEVDQLDYSFSQRCNVASPPNTPQPTSTTTLTTTDENSSSTQPTSTTTTPTTTVSEDTPPNTPTTSTTTQTTTVQNSSPTPPTPTTTPPITVGEENEALQYAVRINGSLSSKAKQPNRLLQILSQSQYDDKQLSETHHCFRIVRIVNDVHQVDRGCVVAANTFHDTCVRANSGVAPIRCRICQFDDCNDARRNRTTSIIIMFTSIISMTFLR